MAVVKIWDVKSSINQVINYTTDENKTKLSDSKYKDLNKSIEYIENGDKTEETLYVSGINCNPENALKEIILIKKKFMKTDGILGYHAYQSFEEGEVTPDEAHEIGLELAKEMWGDRFQVVVSTHLNTKHYHNHFVINSVSFIDGKRYYDNRTTYAELRRLNDLICEEHNKSHLKENKTKSGINYVNYQNKGLTYSNYYKKAKEDLDFALSIANTYNEFNKILHNMGYEVFFRSGKISIRGKDYKRNIRIERYFGKDYSVENIKKQIAGLYLPENRWHYKHSNNYKKNKINVKYNSFYGMYISYCKILKIYPEVVKTHYLSNSMKKDLYELDQIDQETNLLVTNKIVTEDDFFKFLNNKINEIDNLKNQREDLWKNYKKFKTNYDDVKNNVDRLSEKINEIHNEIKLCENIKARKNNIRIDLKNIKDKEMIINESIR